MDRRRRASSYREGGAQQCGDQAAERRVSWLRVVFRRSLASRDVAKREVKVKRHVARVPQAPLPKRAGSRQSTSS